MKRVLGSAVVVAVAVLLGVAVPASAQEDRTVQIGGGLHYPLVSQRFDVQQALGYQVRAGIRIKDNLWANASYQLQSTKDDLSRDGDVDITLYGLGMDYLFKGEEGLRIFVTGALGLGKLDYTNPGEPIEGRPDTTDIDLWYELGGGLWLGKSDRWSVRTAMTYRRLSPDRESALLSGGGWELVPSVDFVWRF